MDGATNAGDRDTVRCAQCERAVPALDYCVVCGDPLANERLASGKTRSEYSAAPDEPAFAIRFFTTLFPHLPRADLDTFRIGFVLGGLVVVILVAAGLYPIALVVAAVIVPLLIVLYIVDVDVYEDEPARVLGATMAWGAGAGVLFAIVNRAVRPDGLLDGTTPHAVAILLDGLIAPLAELALIVAGPLALLRYRRFNDVLDGTTFGVASAAAFSGAYSLVNAVDVLRGGLHPAGDPLPWVLTLFTVAVIRPVLLATASAGVCAALWLRFRAPVRDRGALGFVGRPGPAIAAAGSLLVVAALCGSFLDQIAAAVVSGILAATGLIWLRRAIHLGLLQESREHPIGPLIRCANCGRTTERHTFCGRCGIALKALPKNHGDGTGRRDPGREPS